MSTMFPKREKLAAEHRTHVNAQESEPKNLFFSLPIELQRKIEIMRSHPVADLVRKEIPPGFMFGPPTREYAFPRPYPSGSGPEPTLHLEVD
jgi:hypothetical protein